MRLHAFTAVLLGAAVAATGSAPAGILLQQPLGTLPTVARWLAEEDTVTASPPATVASAYNLTATKKAAVDYNPEGFIWPMCAAGLFCCGVVGFLLAHLHSAVGKQRPPPASLPHPSALPRHAANPLHQYPRARRGTPVEMQPSDSHEGVGGHALQHDAEDQKLFSRDSPLKAASDGRKLMEERRAAAGEAGEMSEAGTAHTDVEQGEQGADPAAVHCGRASPNPQAEEPSLGPRRWQVQPQPAQQKLQQELPALQPQRVHDPPQRMLLPQQSGQPEESLEQPTPYGMAMENVTNRSSMRSKNMEAKSVEAPPSTLQHQHPHSRRAESRLLVAQGDLSRARAKHMVSKVLRSLQKAELTEQSAALMILRAWRARKMRRIERHYNTITKFER